MSWDKLTTNAFPNGLLVAVVLLLLLAAPTAVTAAAFLLALANTQVTRWFDTRAAARIVDDKDRLDRLEAEVQALIRIQNLKQLGR